MKLIATLLAILVLVGCGPHWNMNAKPDVYDQQEQDQRVEKDRQIPYVPASK
jgi:hypothetical protein